MVFYHKYVAPLLLHFFFWDDVVERGYFLFSTNFLLQINLSSFERKSWTNHYLNNNLSNKRKGSKSRTAGLDHVPELGITYNPHGCIYEFFTGLLQQQLCWSNCSSPLRKGRVVRKATGAPLYSCGFQSSITDFFPQTSCDSICWWLAIAAFLPLEDQNPIWYLNYFVPLHWSVPRLKIFQECCLSFLQNQTLLFSYKQTNENPNSSPHPLFKNIIMIICIRRII